MILPRQARDKHRENSQKSGVFLIGSSKNAPNATAWEALLADGWLSAGTPLGEEGCIAESDTHICDSAATTAMFTAGCEFPCWGYQLDWILYRDGEGLSLVEGSAEVDTNPLGEDDCDNKECWEERVAAGTADADALTFCSDHAAVMAKFKLT